VLAYLPALSAALAGDGPALLPHPPDAPPPAALRPGEVLAPGEDDDADPTAVVVTTSGSTGPAKGALLPASALLASAAATHDRLGGPGHWLLALPPAHVAGIQVLVRCLVGGTEPSVLDLSGGFDAAAFVAAAARTTGPRRYTALVPTQVTRLLDGGVEAVAVLAGFDAVLAGGGAIPPALRERARAAGVRLVTTYGMTETCGGCVYDGLPLDGVQARLDGDQTAEEPGGEPPAEPGGGGGRVWLAGPVLARGYRCDPAATAASFHTDPQGRRWFRTDDAARLIHGGRLEILGRLDGMVVTGGRKVSPALVEAALLGVPGVAEATVLGVEDPEWGQRVVAAVVPAAGRPVPDLDAVRARVGAVLGSHAAPRQLLLLDRLPLRGPGKPDLAALARLARAAAGQGTAAEGQG
jgi:O-succinylbenzoic acid--CoA ligase